MPLASRRRWSDLGDRPSSRRRLSLWRRPTAFTPLVQAWLLIFIQLGGLGGDHHLRHAADLRSGGRLSLRSEAISSSGAGVIAGRDEDPARLASMAEGP